MEVEYIKEDQLMKETFSTIQSEDKKMLQQIIENNPIQTMHTKEPTLEEIFIKVTGRGLV